MVEQKLMRISVVHYAKCMDKANSLLSDGWYISEFKPDRNNCWVLLERKTGITEERMSEETLKEGFRFAIEALSPSPDMRERLLDELSTILDEK